MDAVIETGVLVPSPQLMTAVAAGPASAIWAVNVNVWPRTPADGPLTDVIAGGGLAGLNHLMLSKKTPALTGSLGRPLFQSSVLMRMPATFNGTVYDCV